MNRKKQVIRISLLVIYCQNIYKQRLYLYSVCNYYHCYLNVKLSKTIKKWIVIYYLKKYISCKLVKK